LQRLGRAAHIPIRVNRYGNAMSAAGRRELVDGEKRLQP
jgi:hypothetical protein